MTARSIFFRGHVQGVGFRYSTRRIAAGFDVTGWVKNLPDGRVEMHAQAADVAEIEAFLAEIQNSSLGSHIKEREIKPAVADASLRGFSIVRD